jgi:hypothetical protein
LIEKPVEFGPVPTSAGGLLAKDPIAPRFQRSYLLGGVLVVRWRRERSQSALHKHIAIAKRYCNTFLQCNNPRKCVGCRSVAKPEVFEMVHRWVASAWLHTEKKFRRIDGHRDLWTLAVILGRESAQTQRNDLAKEHRVA